MLTESDLLSLHNFVLLKELMNRLFLGLTILDAGSYSSFTNCDAIHV